VTHRHADEGGDVLADAPRVDDRAVAGDDVLILELLDAVDDRRRRQADLLTDLCQRQLAVLLQQREDVQVDVVEFGFWRLLT